MKTITILQLYPKEMNIYGDFGNVLTLKRRLEWHGYNPVIKYHHAGDVFPEDVDIIVGGGGQDSGQGKVQQDLIKIGKKLHSLADQQVPMLMVCGLYQLFGRFFKTNKDEIIKGIGIFKAETIAGPKRLIGNVVIESKFGEIIGYENHSGETFLDKEQLSLGEVKKGEGNSSKDKSEGAIYKNVVGTYLHGSLLPKNPVLADYLIEKAVNNKFGDFQPANIDNGLAELAREAVKKRPR